MKPFLLALSLIATVSAGAATIAPGDLVVYPSDPYPFLEGEHPLSYVLGSDGTDKGTLRNLWPFAVFGPNGHLFVLTSVYYPLPSIAEYDNSLNLIQTITPNFNLLTPGGLLVAPNGDFGVVDAYYGNPVLYMVTSNGQLKATFALPHSGSSYVSPTYDLGSDGCTLLYTDVAHAGRRFNACTGTALPNLADGREQFRPGATDLVRALADGGYVAVHGPTLDFYDAADRLVRSIETPFKYLSGADNTSQVTDLHFDSDSRFLWVAAEDAVYKIRIADGIVVLRAGTFPVTFSVNGERRPTVAEVATSRRRIVPHAPR